MAYEINPQTCAEHLSGAVKFATLSCDHEADMDFGVFFQMHDYLAEAYPLVHATLEKSVVGKAGLLYHWKGTGKSDAAPLMFMAHQDVVPEGNWKDWEFPPYSGTVSDGFVWGRGAGDCKSKMIAALEAVEHLISVGFTPDYDIYLAFGYNEEVSGGDAPSAAGLIAEELIRRGVRVGLALDEGGGVRGGAAAGINGDLCTISVAEKGYADFEIIRRDPGGHSSKPHKGGALDYVAKAILAISENQYPLRLIEPVKKRFESIAGRMKNQELGELMQDMDANWDKIAPIVENDPALAPYFHTTMVATMCHGSAQGNILPEEASATVNCRLLLGDTVESVKKHIESIIPEGMEVRLLKGNDPSPFSDSDTDYAKLLYAMCVEEYGEDMVFLPDITLGGTDAKYMYDAVDCVYRFSFGYIPGEKKPGGGAHAVNETQSVAGLTKAARMNAELIRRYGK